MDHFIEETVDQALLLGLEFCLSQLAGQVLQIVPGRVQLLPNVQRWLHREVGEVENIIIVYSRPVKVERDFIHRGVDSGCSFEGCCVGSNTPWLLRANSDANLILTGASASPWEVKGVRQSVVITNNPSTIDQNQQLLVRFPNLGAHDVIVSETARLAFRITLDSEDANRTEVQNLVRAIVKKTVIKISGNEVISIDDSDVFNCYGDLWKTASERKNDQYQGIDTSGNRNTTRICMDAGNQDEAVAADKAIADSFGNRFYVPLDFELFERETCRSIKARLETGWSTN